MDAAQVKGRWPARYATVLADDPGSSVLTLTSRALVDRVNHEGDYDFSNAIALWKDDTGKERSISLPADADALILTLAGHTRRARSLDGRAVKNSMSWRYHGQQPLKLKDATELRKRIKGD
jgi:hypothetical protein